jgi:PKD repeat protein
MSLVKKAHSIEWMASVMIVLIFSGCMKSGKSDPVAKFVYKKDCAAQTTCQVTFTNQSLFADSYKYDFGDGETSTEANPVHQYSQAKAYYIVKLKANNISSAREAFFEDTVFILDKPECENIGTFPCAKRLESGVSVQDNIIADKNNYYYFVTPKPGVIKLELASVPSGNYLYMDLLSEARENSPVIRTAYGYAGETISYYAGPVGKGTFYVKLNPASIGGENYKLTYTFIYTDSFEVNNTFPQATPIDFSTTRTGNILALNDVDYFSISNETPGTMDITLTPVPDLGAGGQLTVQFFEEANSNSSMGYETGLSGETITFSVGPMNSGTHYIQIRANSRESTGRYKLTVNKDNSDRQEINNSFSQATVFDHHQAIYATLKAAKDVDYYKYTPSVNGKVTISIDKVPSGISYMYVETFTAANSSSMVDRKYERPGNDINFTTSNTLVAGQPFYIKIYSYYNTEQSNEQYSLRIQ